MASVAALELRSLLVPKWEEANGRPYDRRQLVYELNLVQRARKGKVSKEAAEQLIQESRRNLIQRRGIIAIPSTSPQTATVESSATETTAPSPSESL